MSDAQSWFWPVYAVLLATMLACRCIPVFALGGRELSPRVAKALDAIPVAAFSALVANDLFQPGLWEQRAWSGAMPLAAATVVAVCAVKTRSLALSAAVGVAAYIALGALPL